MACHHPVLYGHGSSDYASERGYGYEEVGIYQGRFIRREGRR